MLCVQLLQVMIHRPCRDSTYRLIVVYSCLVFPLTTIGFVGKFRFAELNYVVNYGYEGGPKLYYKTHSNQWANALSKVWCVFKFPFSPAIG